MRGVPILYDLDDAEWVHSRLKTYILVKAAHVVLCGSHGIKKWVERHTERTVFVPTVLDHVEYKKHTPTERHLDVLRIGWVGVGPSYIRDGHFDSFREGLTALVKRGVSVEMVFIGSLHSDSVKGYMQKSGISVKFIESLDWAIPGIVPRTLSEEQVMVGVAPLKATVFDRAKCGFKIIEYMATGLPVVVSPVGEQSVVVRDGVDGLFADTPEEWADTLEYFVDEKNRIRCGESGQKRVAEAYSYESILPLVYTHIAYE